MASVMPFSYDHPECIDGEIYLGNFTNEDAARIGWRTKCAGNAAYCVDGRPFPHQKEHGVRPYFVLVSELIRAGVVVPERGSKETGNGPA